MYVQSSSNSYKRFQFYEVYLGTFQIEYHGLKCSYALDLSCPNKQRLEVSENVKKYIDVTSRASKLQVLSSGTPGFEPMPPV